ncbi:hypothetical protein EV426DRAFT_708556 [Tirmania nivea]|nr:hypothetical protein EV426DRAFT_708556 [Tirmania nivea]
MSYVESGQKKEAKVQTGRVIAAERKKWKAKGKEIPVETKERMEVKKQAVKVDKDVLLEEGSGAWSSSYEKDEEEYEVRTVPPAVQKPYTKRSKQKASRPRPAKDRVTRAAAGGVASIRLSGARDTPPRPLVETKQDV